MKSNERIHLSVPSRLEILDVVQKLAEEIARMHGFDEEGQLDLGLAVREGAVNAMKHGHGLDPALAVELTFRARGDQVAVTIVDQGAGFDPTETPDPTAPNNIWRSSGRGLLLIRSLVDAAEFTRHGDGMELRMVKRRVSAPAANRPETKKTKKKNRAKS